MFSKTTFHMNLSKYTYIFQGLWLRESYDCSTASKVTLNDMGETEFEFTKKMYI